MLVLRVLKKKFKSLPHVMVEGKTLKRLGNCFKQFNTWLDRKIGYLARSVMWPHVKVVPNQIMFLPFNHSVSCNMKYISEEIIRPEGQRAAGIYRSARSFRQNKLLRILPRRCVLEGDIHQFPAR